MTTPALCPSQPLITCPSVGRSSHLPATASASGAPTRPGRLSSTLGRQALGEHGGGEAPPGGPSLGVGVGTEPRRGSSALARNMGSEPRRARPGVRGGRAGPRACVDVDGDQGLGPPPPAPHRLVRPPGSPSLGLSVPVCKMGRPHFPPQRPVGTTGRRREGGLCRLWSFTGTWADSWDGHRTRMTSRRWPPTVRRWVPSASRVHLPGLRLPWPGVAGEGKNYKPVYLTFRNQRIFLDLVCNT